MNVLHHHHPDGPRVDVEIKDTVEKVINAAMCVNAYIPNAAASGVRYRVKFPDMHSANYLTKDEIETRIFDLNKPKEEVAQ
jgi:hypothetical protein